MNHRCAFIFGFTAQCLAGVLFWTLPVNWISTASAESAPGEGCLRSLQAQSIAVDPVNSAVSLAADGETSMTIAIAQNIPSDYYRMLTLTEIAIALANVGDAEQSEQLLLQALEAAATVDQTVSAIDYGWGLGTLQIAVRLADQDSLTGH